MHETEVEARRTIAAAAGGSEKHAVVRTMFERIAPRYDLLNRLLSFGLDGWWRRRALRVLDWARVPDGRYLDLCAGTLDVAAQLARQPGFHGFVIGADFAAPMLAAGAGKAPRSLVSPVAADAQQLPFRAGDMAGALVAFGIRNVASLDAALREAYRVLASDARLVILEFTTPRSRVMCAAYHVYFHHVLPLVGGAISGHPAAYRYLPESVAHFPPEAELAARMRDAGFVDVRWTSLTFGVAAIHSGRRP